MLSIKFTWMIAANCNAKTQGLFLISSAVSSCLQNCFVRFSCNIFQECNFEEKKETFGRQCKFFMLMFSTTSKTSRRKRVGTYFIQLLLCGFQLKKRNKQETFWNKAHHLIFLPSCIFQVSGWNEKYKYTIFFVHSFIDTGSRAGGVRRKTPNLVRI